MGNVAKANLTTPKSRNDLVELPVRRQPYFVTLAPKVTLGYIQRGKGKCGSWVVRRETGRDVDGSPIRVQHTLGLADDLGPNSGMSYAKAIQAALAHSPSATGEPPTVEEACEAYLTSLKANKGERAEHNTRNMFNKHIPQNLRAKKIPDLTLGVLRSWFAGLVQHSEDKPDKERRSKVTANRIMSQFKAALNHAFQDDANNIPSDKAWRAVKAYKGVSASRQDHFSEPEVQRLLDAARGQDPAFANLLEAAFYTGARPPGELAILDVRHFDPARQTIYIPDGKTGPRVTTLTREGAEFFRRVSAGKRPDDILLPRSDGERWGKSEQHRPMKLALAAAELPKTATAYTMRHTYISRAIERGMPLTLIAENVGTSVKMIEQNYGKFTAEARRALIEKHAPTLRVIEGGLNVAA